MIFGIISLALGIIGIFVPILPTTPFLLLSAACFARSSEKLYNWLMGHRIFGRYITLYIKHGAIPKSSKIISLCLLWLSIGYVSLFKLSHIGGKCILLLIAVAVSIHILSLKTNNSLK